MSIYAEIRSAERQLEACTDPAARRALECDIEILRAAARSESREDAADDTRLTLDDELRRDDYADRVRDFRSAA